MPECVVTPGFIDGHRHVWCGLLRGARKADWGNWTLPEYMVEARSMYCGCFGADDEYVANYFGGLESLNAGITSVVDHSHLQKSPDVSDALARGLKDSGVGGFFCYSLQNVPNFVDNGSPDPDAIRDLLMRAPDAWHDEAAAHIRAAYFLNGPLRFGVALPESTAYVPSDVAKSFLARAAALKPELVTCHWDAMQQGGEYASTLVELAPAFPSATLLSHCNHLNDADLTLMANSGIGLCTCPDTESGMGLGPMPGRRLTELGGAASLGCDITCLVQADMLKQARAYLQAEEIARCR